MNYKEHLQGLVLQNEANGWLDSIDSYSNHRPMLMLALSLTKGRVIEMGSGFGSTPYLTSYCYATSREFLSFDYNMEWANKTGSAWVQDWDKDLRWQKPCGLLFVDHSPGEHRHVAIKMMMDKADVICVHDSEIGGAGDYKLEKVRPLFKYELGFNIHQGGAGCTLLSNKVDVSKFKGLTYCNKILD